jgi:Tfp pilus assembly protein PilN
MKAINLLPSDARRSFGTVRSVGGSTAVLFGALAVALAVVAAYVVLTNGVTNKRDALNAINAQQAAAERQVAALKPYADLEQVRQSLLDRVRTLASSRYDWPATLARLARAFPADAGLTDLSASAGENGAGPSVALTGCTPSHDAVAVLIDRLRAVKGVAGVALQSSKVATGTSTGSGQGACAGRPESFQMTVDLEGAAGATSAGTTAATPSVPAGATTTPAPTTSTPAATPATGGTQ